MTTASSAMKKLSCAFEKALSPSIGSAAAARDQAEGETHRRDLLELEAPAEVAAEHGAHAPEPRRAERLDDRRQTLRVRRQRMLQRDQPDAGERGQQEPGEAWPRLLAEHEPRAGDGDERLHLLQHEHRDEVAVEERLREEDRGDGGGACADGDAGCDVARARAPERAQGDDEQRQGQGDEDDVLAEDDRRRTRRVRERLADQSVEPPHRRGDADEDDTGDVAQALHLNRA